MQNLIKEIKSGVVSISFYKFSQECKKIASGSAFLCKNRIITNNHIFHPDGLPFSSPKDIIVEIKIDEFLGLKNGFFRFDYEKLADYVVVGSDINSNDYIVLDVKNENFFSGKFQFELGSHKDVEVGEEILVAGYPFEHKNLTFHFGRVSAKYEENVTNIIQIDAAINNGNSGGPLVDIKTKKVVGIITRKATGLTKAFDNLLNSTNQNIELLRKANRGLLISGVSLVDYMIMSQNQIKVATREIKRSANVGIGYAFSCDKLIQENFYNLF